MEIGVCGEIGICVEIGVCVEIGAVGIVDPLSVEIGAVGTAASHWSGPHGH